MKTKDLAIANSRYAKVLAGIEDEFKKARLKQSLIKEGSLDSIDTEWIAKTWFEEERQKIYEADVGFISSDSKQTCIEDVGLEYTMLRQDDFATYGGSVVKGLLVKEGFPEKPVSEEHKKFGLKKSYEVDLDKIQVKYQRFFQLIKRGLIRLCEIKLEMMGVDFDPLPSFYLFQSGTELTPPKKVGAKKTLSLIQLVDMFLSRFKDNVDDKTYSDKSAALKFLTDYVGGDAVVNDLKREHFNDLRDKLIKYPSVRRHII